MAIHASLSVRFGGLRTRHIQSVAIPAFLASAVGTRDPQDHILHTNLLLRTVTLTDVVSCGTNIVVKFNHSHHLLSSQHGTNRLWNANCRNSRNA